MDAQNWNQDIWNEAWLEYCSKLDKFPHRKFIHTQDTEIIPYSVNILNAYSGVGKPAGLWYSSGSGWLSWCLGENFGFGPNLFEIELDMTRIFVISNVDEFDEFSEKYGIGRSEYFSKLQYNRELERRGVSEDIELLENIRKTFKSLDLTDLGFVKWFRKDYIDWQRFLKDTGYAGIEINPYLWERRLDGGMWYYGWDCASGVIWDKTAVLSTLLIAQYDETSNTINEIYPLEKNHEGNQAFRT